MRRWPPPKRSMAGPMNGASRANGAMLITRYSSTWSRDADGLRLKKSEPASETATSASAAPPRAWAAAMRFSPGVQTTRVGMRRRNSWITVPCCRNPDRTGADRGLWAAVTNLGNVGQRNSGWAVASACEDRRITAVPWCSSSVFSTVGGSHPAVGLRFDRRRPDDVPLRRRGGSRLTPQNANIPSAPAPRGRADGMFHWFPIVASPTRRIVDGPGGGQRTLRPCLRIRGP